MEPAPGLMAFHLGRPVEILYRVSGETWRVRPIFVEGPDRDEQFQPGDRLTRIHTQYVAARSSGSK